jgi:hypothetical protein
VILFSEGYRNLFDSNPLTLAALRNLIDAANRAAVLIYTVDPRGLPYTGATAADKIQTIATGPRQQTATSVQYEGLFNSRSNELVLTQTSLAWVTWPMRQAVFWSRTKTT